MASPSGASRASGPPLAGEPRCRRCGMRATPSHRRWWERWLHRAPMWRCDFCHRRFHVKTADNH